MATGLSEPRERPIEPSHPTVALSNRRLVAPLLLIPILVLSAIHVPAQDSPDAHRINERLRALQREAERLAGESRSLLGELRTREIERSIRIEQLKQAEATAAAAEKALHDTSVRLSDLEVERLTQLPDLRAQLVDVYKRGRSGYARMLFGVSDVREFARATRAVGAMSALNQRRVDEHRRTLEALRGERAMFEQHARELQAKTAEARRAKTSADAAVAAAAELIRQIDSRRDLTAQYVGELQVAYSQLQDRVDSLSTERDEENVTVPLRPFQGALDWPVNGRLVGFFGQPSNRLGGSAVRNGVEIAAAEDAMVRAVHGGSVGYAGPFTGFGTLVILDHGNNGYSLYGYLASTPLQEGDRVDPGAEVGRVGLAPAGPPTLYFEMRIDGRSVNPVQWLEPR